MTPKRIFVSLLVTIWLAFAPRASAADAFIKFDGVEGESTHQDHKGEIELDSFQVSSLRSAAERASQSSGAGAGRVTFNPFSITRKVDRASAKIAQACATGKHFPTATISVRKAGGRPMEYLVVKLQDVMVSSYRTSGAGAAQTESFMLQAGSAMLVQTGVPTPAAGVKNVPVAPAAARN